MRLSNENLLCDHGARPIIPLRICQMSRPARKKQSTIGAASSLVASIFLFSIAFIAFASISASAQQPDVLASVRVGVEFLAYDDGYIYFAENLNLGNTTGHMRRVAASGGTVETVTVFTDFSYADDTFLSYFQVVGNTIYGELGGYLKGQLYSVPKSGGTPTILRNVQDGLTYLGRLSGEIFYMSDWSKIMRFPATQIASGYYVRGRAWDASYMYFYGRRMDRNGATLTLFPSHSFEDGYYVDSQYLFQATSGGSIINRVPKTGGAVVQLVSGAEVSAKGTDGSYFYFTNASSLRRVPVSGGQTEVVLPYTLPLKSFCFGNGEAYCARAELDGTYSILRIPLDAVGNSCSSQVMAANSRTITFDGVCSPSDTGSNEIRISVRPACDRHNRALVSFDLSGLSPSSTITSAKLRLYCLYTSEYQSNQVVASRLLEPWSPGEATWSTKRAGEAWSQAGGTYMSTGESTATVPSKGAGNDVEYNEWVEWDVTAIVHGWVAGTFENHGLILVQPPNIDAGNQSLHFATVDHSDGTLIPRLCLAGEIQYTPPGATDFEYKNDALDRLVGVEPNNGIKIEYVYDSSGNRLSKEVSSLLTIGAGASMPESGGIENTDTDRAVMQIALTTLPDSEDTILNRLTIAPSGSADESAALSQAELWNDVNGDGNRDAGDELIASIPAPSTDNGQLNFSGLNLLVPSGETQNLLLTYDLNGSATTGQTFAAEVTSPGSIGAVGASSGRSIYVLGAPVTGPILTISTDTTGPTFAGIDSAVAGDQTATLSWLAGTDSSTPLTYGIWILSDETRPLTVEPQATTEDLSHVVTGLNNGQVYWFAVRARDAAGNWDSQANPPRLPVIPFRPLFELDVSSGPNGSVLAEPDHFAYEQGTSVSVIPTGNDGYIFSGWTGDVPPGQETSAPLNLVMDADKSVQAAFERATGTVHIQVTPLEGAWQLVDGDGNTILGQGNGSTSGVPTGNVTLSWQPLDGLVSPPSRTKQLSMGGSVTFAGTYVAEVAFSSEPSPMRRYVGDSAQFAVSVSGGLEPLHFAWRLVSQAKALIAVGTNSPTFSIPAVQLDDGGEYWCVVTDAQPESYLSASAMLDVAEHLQVIDQPQGGDYSAGDSHTFSVTVTGGFEPLVYTWKKDGIEVGDAPTHTIATLDVSDSGLFTVEILDDNGDAVVSIPAQLTVGTGTPVVGRIGIALLIALCAIAGALLLMRKRIAMLL